MPGPASIATDPMAFWTERHICSLASVRPDGTPHLVPVGVVYDPATGLARIITSSTSAKARRIAAAGTLPVAVTQVDGARWTTLEGVARINSAPEAVAEAERRYTERYGEPRPNPLRVAIEIEVRRVLGSVKVPLPEASS
ncbi:TIGR03618 family F420-dependent PPOX class oxidoreductase [Catenulispora pinisilvae]|uniref:TIGR03618 family F420-dependent PPOX class oxidoreductase n=1 Tax=Catenulispora pinisilvae TaxID=2705253 RepID=UPI001890DF8F|nr:TIGR03618 family F420-dependent PPOX class oxidoreductase [Catenulispora pinisilvae]